MLPYLIKDFYVFMLLVIAGFMSEEIRASGSVGICLFLLPFVVYGKTVFDGFIYFSLHSWKAASAYFGVVVVVTVMFYFGGFCLRRFVG